MEAREHRYRVAIYISPGYQDTHSIRTELGRTIARAGYKRAEYVLLTTTGMDLVNDWFKQAKAVLRLGSVFRVTKELPDWEGLAKDVDPQYLLYFSKDCTGIEEKSKLISSQGIDYRITLMGTGDR